MFSVNSKLDLAHLKNMLLCAFSRRLISRCSKPLCYPVVCFSFRPEAHPGTDNNDTIERDNDDDGVWVTMRFFAASSGRNAREP